MTTTDTPKFSIWLGDGWPGPYVVTFEKDKRKTGVCVVNGVSTMGEAIAIAAAEYPGHEHDVVSVCPANIAEASHHMDVLREHREKLKEPPK